MHDIKYEYQQAFDAATAQGVDEESAARYARDTLADYGSDLLDLADLEAGDYHILEW